MQVMRTAASALSSIYPNSEHVKALYANTVRLLKDEQNAKMQKFIAENGQNSPDKGEGGVAAILVGGRSGVPDYESCTCRGV